MNCQRVQESFVEYQAGTLSITDSATVRAHLKTCLTCQREWAGLQETALKLERLELPTPSPRLRANFYAMLEEEQRAADEPSPFALARSKIDAFFASLLPSRPALQAAFALALLAGGLVVGAKWLHTPPPNTIDPAVQKELTDLRQKVDSVGQLVAFSVQQQQSGTSRLQGVLAALDNKNADDRTLAELLNTLAFDPSTNVRLCALEALYAHVSRDPVRAGVLAALPRERSPLVQVAMIDFIAAARDRAALSTLEELSRTTYVDKAVRDAAQRAIVQL